MSRPGIDRGQGHARLLSIACLFNGAAPVAEPWDSMMHNTISRGAAARGLDGPQTGQHATSFTDFAPACGGCSIIEEADHRIANHLALIVGLVRLKASDLSRRPAQVGADQVQMLLESVGCQIDAVASLHRSFAQGDRYASIDVGARLHEICTPLKVILPARIVLTEDFADGCFALPSQSLPLSQIVCEVITNAVKHAYPLETAGRIVVRVRKDATQAVVVEVIDNGPGLSGSFDAMVDSGLGFRLIRALTKQLGAVVVYQSDLSGLLFRLTLP
jgi:two-component sensor histidine kinase